MIECSQVGYNEKHDIYIPCISTANTTDSSDTHTEETETKTVKIEYLLSTDTKTTTNKINESSKTNAGNEIHESSTRTSNHEYHVHAMDIGNFCTKESSCTHEIPDITKLELLQNCWKPPAYYDMIFEKTD